VESSGTGRFAGRLEDDSEGNLYDIFYIEKWGTGIARMRRLTREHGLAEPHLEDLDDFFAVTFYGPGDRILDLIPEEGVTDRSAEHSRRSLDLAPGPAAGSSDSLRTG